MIRLWRGGYISFNPEDSVPIFAFLALILLLGVVIITVIAGIWISETGWMDRLTTALGHAITAVIGAIVGSSAAKATSK